MKLPLGNLTPSFPRKRRASGAISVLQALSPVMAVLVTAIHVLWRQRKKPWMPGTRPGMTVETFPRYGRRSLRISLLLSPLLFAAPAAWAHAFLDHASPAVGSTVRQAPAAISLWFTQELEPAFSSVSIVDQSGQRVDGGDARVDGRDQTLLRASLKPLPPGTYKVLWHVVSVDTHTTEGSFTFRVAG